MNLSHKLVAATTAEINSRGAGMIVRAGISSSPFGRCFIADSPRGICYLSFYDSNDKSAATGDLLRTWPLADMRWEPSHARALADEVFSCNSAMRVFVAGTEFQVRVWRALTRIPMGGTLAYGELAAAVGKPKAARATGSAVGANPVSFLIPCHRIVLADGATGHYHWGPGRKRAMLQWEAKRITSG